MLKFLFFPGAPNRSCASWQKSWLYADVIRGRNKNRICVVRFLVRALVMPPRSQRQQQQQASARNDDTCQAVIYTLPRQRSPYYENYCCRQSMCCGTTLLITGLLSIVLQSVSIAAGLIYSTVCHGIWCGVMVSHTSNQTRHTVRAVGLL